MGAQQILNLRPLPYEGSPKATPSRTRPSRRDWRPASSDPGTRGRGSPWRRSPWLEHEGSDVRRDPGSDAVIGDVGQRSGARRVLPEVLRGSPRRRRAAAPHPKRRAARRSAGETPASGSSHRHRSGCRPRTGAAPLGSRPAASVGVVDQVRLRDAERQGHLKRLERRGARFDLLRCRDLSAEAEATSTRRASAMERSHAHHRSVSGREFVPAGFPLMSGQSS